MTFKSDYSEDSSTYMQSKTSLGQNTAVIKYSSTTSEKTATEYVLEPIKTVQDIEKVIFFNFDTSYEFCSIKLRINSDFR